jgi:hypothetical protein
MLAASAVSCGRPPAGPEWRRGVLPFASRPMKFERAHGLCVALDGFALHAATRAGRFDEQGREALLTSRVGASLVRRHCACEAPADG